MHKYIARLSQQPTNCKIIYFNSYSKACENVQEDFWGKLQCKFNSSKIKGELSRYGNANCYQELKADKQL